MNKGWPQPGKEGRVLYRLLILVGCFSYGMLFMGAACQPDGCVVNETRCNLNRAEICGSDQNWRVNVDCEAMGGETIDWVCCWVEADPELEVPEGHSCLPVECP